MNYKNNLDTFLIRYFWQNTRLWKSHTLHTIWQPFFLVFSIKGNCRGHFGRKKIRRCSFTQTTREVSELIHKIKGVEFQGKIYILFPRFCLGRFSIDIFKPSKVEGNCVPILFISDVLVLVRISYLNVLYRFSLRPRTHYPYLVHQ